MKYILYMIPAILFFTGCSKQQASGSGFSMPPMPVETTHVSKQDVKLYFDAVGTIEAVESITVVSEIDGAVVRLPFVEGSSVKKGDLIAQLDDSQLIAEVNRTEALYLQSQANYKRVKEVVDQKAGTPQDLDDATAALKVAEANLALARSRFIKTRIVAPFDGIVGTRKVSVGTFLRTGQSITELANLDEIRVEFSAPERFMSQLRKDAEVTVSTPVYPGHEVNGKIIAIEPVLNPETRSVQIVALVKNPGQKFRPGMSANVSVVLSEKQNALTIPNEAVFANGNQSFVFVVKPDSSVARVPITMGLQLPKVVEVVHGLEAGGQVVSAGHQKLFDGAKVIPIASNEEPVNRQ
ncbi:MAG TPA: efflux RND transporter periplasmic adaptor subunit [Ignavibacteriaceae bacterium]|nr:efflux RND transporter periplasmic adaptor subunit [Ignavibacteriaceae bacterium]